MKYAFALAAALVATPMVASAQVSDGSFETQGGASIGTNGYCYLSGGCATGDWSSANGGGGFIGVNNGDWPGVQGDGSYLAFIQGGGVLSQTFTAASTGLFSLSFLDAGRSRGGYNGTHAYIVTLNGTSIFQGLTDGQTATGTAFTARNSSNFGLTAGQSYTLSFNGIANGDTTSFIDNLQVVTAVPEPATWAMMLVGLGGVGSTMRRRKSKVSTRPVYA